MSDPTDPQLPTADDPSQLLIAAQVRDPADPAVNRKHPDAQRALIEYDRTRSPAALAALARCALPGRKLRQFHLSPMTTEGVVFATEGTDPRGLLRCLRAFQCAVFLIVDEQGQRHEADMLVSSGTRQATREWVDRMAARFGQGAVREMGALALRRAEVTSETADPYEFLPGAPALRL